MGYFCKAILRSIVTPSDPKSPVPGEGDLSSTCNLKKLRSFYASCMDQERLAKLGRKPIEPKVGKILELYPVTESSQRKSLSRLLAYNMKNGFESLLRMKVRPSATNTTKNILYLVPGGGLGLDSSDYTNGTRIQLYKKTMGEMFYLIRGNFTSPDAALREPLPEVWVSTAKSVTEFEMKLAKINVDVEDEGPVELGMAPISELKKLTPSIDWNLILKTALPKHVPVPAMINVGNPDYLQKVDTLLQQTEPNVLQNYFLWTMIHERADYLSESYRAPIDEFRKVVLGLEAVPERWVSCIDHLTSALGPMAGHYYIEATINNDTIAKTNDMIDSIRQEFAKAFREQYEWMDPDTTKVALEKLNNILQKVAGSLTFYEGYKVDKRDFMGNMVRLETWEAQRNFEDLTKPVDRRPMFFNPQDENASYSLLTNAIEIPAAYMQSPMFHAESPEYQNYGQLGSIVGHEIGHAFDSHGRLFDENGNLRNWWTNSSSEAFDSRAECFVRQYGNFTIKGPDGKDYPVDGETSLGENIADNSGLDKAFQTWLERYKSDPESKTYNNLVLPGLEQHTPQQLFFVGYAQNWCSKTTPESNLQSLKVGVHSPDNVRIKGVVQNSKDFAEAFQCKSGAPMNPVKKCKLL
ncbi:hypothetical protein BGX28_001481 [Mortierella sp. GBA30]|nr:hypothetical protein BGX28_001481 [Mortierella sp. GBA30]